jgi:hypothetical protein
MVLVLRKTWFMRPSIIVSQQSRVMPMGNFGMAFVFTGVLALGKIWLVLRTIFVVQQPRVMQKGNVGTVSPLSTVLVSIGIWFMPWTIIIVQQTRGSLALGMLFVAVTGRCGESGLALETS